MPNPTADHSTATADPYDSDSDSDYEPRVDDDGEYEYEEVEEEVEVEDEENEEDEEDAEFGEDLSPVNEDQQEGSEDLSKYDVEKKNKRGGNKEGSSGGSNTNKRKWNNNTSNNVGGKQGEAKKKKEACGNCGKNHQGACLKGKIVCYNCGQEGHISPNCPNPKKNKRCFVCEAEDHQVKNCPKKGTNGGSGNKGGNKSKLTIVGSAQTNWPTDRTNMTVQDAVASRDVVSGSEALSKYNQEKKNKKGGNKEGSSGGNNMNKRKWNNNTSNVGGKQGEAKKKGEACGNCGKNHQGACLKGKIVCYNCGQEGHISPNCPNPKKNKRCFVCEAEDHQVKNCPKKGTNGGSGNKGGNKSKLTIVGSAQTNWPTDRTNMTVQDAVASRDVVSDVTHDIKTTGQQEQFDSGSITQEKSVLVLSTDTYAVKVNKGPNMTDQMDTAEEEESHINSVNPKYSELGKVVIASEDHEYQESSAAGKRTPKDQGDAHYTNKDPLNGNVILNVHTFEPSSKCSDELTAAVSVKDDFSVEATGIHYSEEETKRMCLQSDDIKHRVQRLDVPMARPRSLSPGTEFKDGNKRPVVTCDFFAKGWCIKGKSCRFLHIRDVTNQQLVGAEADANQKTAQRTNEGSEGCTEKPQLTGFLDGASSSAVDTSHSSERVLSQELGQSSTWKDESQDLNLFKDNNKSIPTFKNVGRESPRENWYSGDYGKYNSEEMAGKKNQFLLDGHSFPLFGHSRNTSSNTSLQNVTGPLPSTHISTLTRSYLPFGSSSWNLDPLGSHKCFDGDREYGASRSASLQQSSESENPYWKDVSGDYTLSGGYRTKISSYNWEYNWEPSAPFHPSSSIARRLLSSVNQYDPILDSIEPPKSLDGVSKFSTSSQGMSGPGYNFGKQSHFGHYHNHDNVLDNKNYGKDSISAKAETVVTAIAEPRNRNAFPKEEKLLKSANVKYITKGSTTNTDHDYVNQSDGLIQKTKSKIETDGQTSEMDVDLNIDEDMLRESKALKLFRVALIDFVKELVKPTWREGNLSKDAHKMIVKRAVDRVLSTIPAHQIPCTPESVKLYLSSSQPKIAKLVEGYIDKYGKV